MKSLSKLLATIAIEMLEIRFTKKNALKVKLAYHLIVFPTKKISLEDFVRELTECEWLPCTLSASVDGPPTSLHEDNLMTLPNLSMLEYWMFTYSN